MINKLKRKSRLFVITLLIEGLISLGLMFLCVYYKNTSFISKNGAWIVCGYLAICLFGNATAYVSTLKNDEDYITRSDISISTIFGKNVAPAFKFGNIVIILYNEQDDIFWMLENNMLRPEEYVGKKVYELVPDFDQFIINQEKEDQFIELSGMKFKIELNPTLRVIYLQDYTSTIIKDTEALEGRPFIGHIVIDNYQDVSVSLNEEEFARNVSQVKEIIQSYIKKYSIFIHSYNNDSFLIFGEEKRLQEMIKDDFSILEDVRKNQEENDSPLTISIGIGKGLTTSLLRTSELSYVALNMALSRGGDQIVINDFGKPLEYFGAKNEIKQTRSHIRGRVLSTSLSNLIEDSNLILIMGHKNMDFDALGSALGIYNLCKSLNKEAYIVYEDEQTEEQTRKAFKETFNSQEINKMTINSNSALELVSSGTLEIIVDTNIADMLIQPKLLDDCDSICLIDHHRKGEGSITNLVFQYHEPSTSSASELVTELINYQNHKIDMDDRIATMLLAGICLDTKFFTSGTTSKTFEMAMILKNYKASMEDVNGFFHEEYEEKRLITSIVNTAKAISVGVYEVVSDDEDLITRSVLSKAANELLNTRGINAVFAIGRTNNNEISVSARSNSEFNVQIIMESCGGGGHFSKAAAQFNSTNVEEVKELIESKVRIYIRDGK